MNIEDQLRDELTRTHNQLLRLENIIKQRINSIHKARKYIKDTEEHHLHLLANRTLDLRGKINHAIYIQTPGYQHNL